MSVNDVIEFIEYTKSLKAANEQLMTCPFCGSKAHIEEHVFHTYCATYGVRCDNENCLAESDQFYDTMGEAVVAWNTRVTDDKPVVRGENIGTLAESDQFICSKCGIHLQDWVRVEVEADGDLGIYEYVFNFCPNCGADMRKEANDER